MACACKCLTMVLILLFVAIVALAISFAVATAPLDDPSFRLKRKRDFCELGSESERADRHKLQD